VTFVTAGLVVAMVYKQLRPIAVAGRCKAWLCGLTLAGIAGSNPAGGHGCLSFVSVVCCQVEVSATGWSLVQRSPTECGVSKVWSWSLEKWGGIGPQGAVEPLKKICVYSRRRRETTDKQFFPCFEHCVWIASRRLFNATLWPTFNLSYLIISFKLT
jgi:hypothetical protein